MFLTFAGREIRRILVLDDAKDVRESMSYALTEAGTEPVIENGPIRSVASFLSSVSRRADAVLSDYRLTPGNYAPVQGDVLVASCTRKQMPALLCTTYANIDIMVDRQLMRYIPVILRTINPEPDQIKDALWKCVSEISGNIPPSRKPWRTLVRVDEVVAERGYCHVVIPGRDAEQKIRLSLESFSPDVLRVLEEGKKLHARVNTGADNHQDLFFDEWEPD